MTNPAHFLDWFSSTAWYYKPPSAHLRLLFFLSFFTSPQGHPNITIIKTHTTTSGIYLASVSHPLFEVYTLPLWVYIPPPDISTWPPRPSTNNISTTIFRPPLPSVLKTDSALLPPKKKICIPLHQIAQPTLSQVARVRELSLIVGLRESPAS